jgi:hypothetical protein
MLASYRAGLPDMGVRGNVFKSVERSYVLRHLGRGKWIPLPDFPPSPLPVAPEELRGVGEGVITVWCRVKVFSLSIVEREGNVFAC